MIRSAFKRLFAYLVNLITYFEVTISYMWHTEAICNLEKKTVSLSHNQDLDHYVEKFHPTRKCKSYKQLNQRQEQFHPSSKFSTKICYEKQGR